MFSIGGGLMYILTMHGLKASEQSSISLLLVLTQFLVAAVLSGVHYDARAEYTSGIMVMEGGLGLPFTTLVPGHSHSPQL